MDTLFRLVSLQSDQSFNSSRTSSSSRSSRQNYHHHHQDEECCNIFMDEDDFSSSSSKHFYPYQQHQHHPSTTTTTTNPTPTNTTSTPLTMPWNLQSSLSPQLPISALNSLLHQRLVNGQQTCSLRQPELSLIRTAPGVQQLMWMLNELSSPYGDTDQKLAAYFLQALFSRMTDSGDRSYRSLVSASEKTCSFESTRKMVLKFQEVSPWTTFGHVASNGAILEAFEGEAKLHIVDISNTYCTQWPTLLEALATRSDETPHLRLTTVVANKAGAGPGGVAAVQKLMKEIGNRMEKFARLMGVPFKFNVVHHSGDLSDLNFAELEIKEDEALAINCVSTLHSVSAVSNRRDFLVSSLSRLRPKIVTVVEDEADLDVGLDGFDFVKGFQECVRWFRVYFDAMDGSFPRTSNERLMLERAAGRAIVDLVACPPAESIERRDSASRWSGRLHGAGFNPFSFSDDVSDDVRALLRRYREGWSMTQCSDAGIFLAWKDQPVVWASAWKP